MKEFADEKGNLFVRERDGEWERWMMVLEKLGPKRKVLYRYRAAKTPIEFADMLDRYDDLRFLKSATQGWIADATERKILPAGCTASLQHAMASFHDALEDLGSRIEAIRPDGEN